MTLAYDAMKEGFSWKIEPSQVNLVTLKRGVWITLSKKGCRREIRPFFYPVPAYSGNSPTFDFMLAAALRARFPSSKVLNEWFNDKGNVFVKINTEYVDEKLEYISTAIHTGLRKLAGSPQSVLTWNAINGLHNDDCSALWNAARECVVEGLSKNFKLNKIAETLKEKLDQTLEFLPLKDRTDSQKTAAVTLQMGIRLTEKEEWMHSWLGYVLKPDDDKNYSAP